MKQGPTQRYSNKSFITQAHHSEVPRLTVCTHSQKDFNDIRCQEAPDDGVAETAEEHTFTQSKKTGDGEEPPMSSPEQKAKFALTKISKTAAGYTSYILMPAVFSEITFCCLKWISTMPANQWSQAYKDIHSKQVKGTWAAQTLLPKQGT